MQMCAFGLHMLAPMCDSSSFQSLTACLDLDVILLGLMYAMTIYWNLLGKL